MATPPPFQAQTVEYVVESFCQRLSRRVEAGSVSPLTLRTYASDLTDFTDLAGPTSILDELEPDDIMAILACHARIPDRRRTLHNTPLTFERDSHSRVKHPTGPTTRSQASRARFAATVRALFSYASERNFVRSDPMPEVDSVSAPRKAKGARLGISAAQAGILIQVPGERAGLIAPDQQARDHQVLHSKAGDRIWLAVRDELVLRLLAEPGLRVSELVAANIEDLGVGEHPPGHPGHPGQGKNFRFLHVIGKGRRPRTVPLSPAAEIALNRWLLLPRPDGDTAALLVSVRGRRLDARDVQRLLDRRLAQMPAQMRTRVTPHGLRHTAATVMVREAGVDVATAADLLGHASVSTTSIYLDSSESASADAVAATSRRYRQSGQQSGQ